MTHLMDHVKHGGQLLLHHLVRAVYGRWPSLQDGTEDYESDHFEVVTLTEITANTQFYFVDKKI